ncbi:hypothetical protein GOP47_0014749 [Adiantum capillus-veneris]|uniref:Patatin n=1 Tax=Adiantum capillus-veneris TaxID=13818 RepID=A0A9D4ZF41_ADICA|nr:hypothetical protein GOP47_0014749 [Adiantum capillus-veneris]
MAAPIAGSGNADERVGRRVSILSIDGGGVRGLIPCKMLEFLEHQLQIVDGPNARIVDYFDVIAGTSTGGLIASALALPDEKGRPRYTAKDASNFYIQDGTTIFTRRSNIPVLSTITGPKYEASGLEEILKDVCRDVKIKDTLTDVVIPTFDIKLMEPTYFSTCEAKRDESKNAFIRDVLRGTTAAPIYFPPALFYTTNCEGERRAFNLIDGGVGINNPTHHAIVHVQREIFRKNPIYASRILKGQDLKSLLVLSLGTGSFAESYNSEQASRWGIVPWVINEGKVPILDIITGASADVVDFNLAVLFTTFECPENYLRIQPTNLSGDVASFDNAQSGNINNLLEISEKVLNRHVKLPDVDTGKYISHPNRGTNKEALTRFAKKLSKERKGRCHFAE